MLLKTQWYGIVFSTVVFQLFTFTSFDEFAYFDVLTFKKLFFIPTMRLREIG
jgi:hypothetical protein